MDSAMTSFVPDSVSRWMVLQSERIWQAISGVLAIIDPEAIALGVVPIPRSWAQHSTGSDPSRPDSDVAKLLPPELFDLILSFVASSLYGERTLRRPQTGEDTRKMDSLRHLKMCNLVCRHWARRCRRFMFGGARIYVCSHEDAALLVGWAIKRRKWLTPVLYFVGEIQIVQGYNITSSFLHHAHLIHALRSRAAVTVNLTLCGPVPYHVPHHQLNLNTPHWSIPPWLTTPPSLLTFRNIAVENIHLPSFNHVMRYVRHLTHAKEEVRFKKLTWDELAPGPLPRFSTKTPPYARRRHCDVGISATSCTDNFRLCLYAQMARSDCPLHRVPRVQLVVSLMQALWELYPSDASKDYFYLRWDTNGSDQRTRVRLECRPGNDSDNGTAYPNLTFTLGNINRLHDATSTSLHLISCNVYFIAAVKSIPIHLGGLLMLLMAHRDPQLRLIYFHFSTYRQLKEWMERYPSAMINPQNNNVTYALICKRSSHEENSPFPDTPRATSRYHADYLRISPTTLEPMGSSWRRHSDLESALYEEAAHVANGPMPV